MLQLRVCLAATETSLPVAVPDAATVADLRAAIFAAAPARLHPAKHRLRLIAAGKLLHPAATLASASVHDGDFIHCAVSELDAAHVTDPKTDHADAASQHGPRPILVTEDATGETRILLPAATQTIATLRAAGLSDEQIIAVRFSFLLDEEEEAGGEPLRLDLDELEANERLALAAQNPGGVQMEMPEAEDGAWTDYLYGFTLGALLGLIMLILSLDRSIALSRRWKRGIAMGALLNVVFGVALLVNDGSPR